MWIIGTEPVNVPKCLVLGRQQQWTDDHAGEEILLQKADSYQEHLGFAPYFDPIVPK